MWRDGAADGGGAETLRRFNPEIVGFAPGRYALVGIQRQDHVPPLHAATGMKPVQNFRPLQFVLPEILESSGNCLLVIHVIGKCAGCADDSHRLRLIEFEQAPWHTAGCWETVGQGSAIVFGLHCGPGREERQWPAAGARKAEGSGLSPP